MPLNDSNNTSKNDNTLVQVADNGQLDAFGRIRTSNPNVLFEANFVNGEKNLLFSGATANGGTITFDQNNASMNLNVTTTNDSRAVRQTKKYFHYVSGNSLLLFLTGKFGTAKTNCIQRIGYFDDNNGVFFELNGTTLNVVLRSNTSGSVVETRIAQSAFNLDKIDGTGVSETTFDATKQQIFVIDLQWLGSGRIRFGINGGECVTYIHQITNANSNTTVYMRSGSLPIRYEIVNSGTTSGSTTLRMTCMSIMSEGSINKPDVARSVDMQDSPKTVGGLLGAGAGVMSPMIAIRLKSSFNRATIIPKFLSLACTTPDIVSFRLILNPTLTGASWTSVDTDSITEYDVSATAYTGGTILRTFYVGDNNTSTPNLDDNNLKLNADINGTTDILLVAGAGIEGNATLIAAINFLEEL